jgi:hypothetical protein
MQPAIGLNWGDHHEVWFLDPNGSALSFCAVTPAR